MALTESALTDTAFEALPQPDPAQIGEQAATQDGNLLDPGFNLTLRRVTADEA